MITEEQRQRNRKEYIDNIGCSDSWFKSCRIPRRYYGKNLDNFSGFKREIEASIKSIESNESIFLTGGCGTGKTHMAIGLIMEWIKRHIHWKQVNSEVIPLIDGDISDWKPYFLPSVELFLKLKSTFGDKNISEDDIIREIMRYPLLVIDDVGAEKISDWSRQMFYTLIDRCYRDMKPVIITSNMDLSKIAEAFDDRIASRIVGMGSVITLTGDDYRMNK